MRPVFLQNSRLSRFSFIFLSSQNNQTTVRDGIKGVVICAILLEIVHKSAYRNCVICVLNKNTSRSLKYTHT